MTLTHGTTTEKFFDDEPMVGTARIVSEIINTARAARVIFQLQWTGSPRGGLVVEVSNGTGPGGEALPWDPLPLDTRLINPAGFPDSGSIYLLGEGWLFMRLTYTNTSGSGVLNAWHNVAR